MIFWSDYLSDAKIYTHSALIKQVKDKKLAKNFMICLWRHSSIRFKDSYFVKISQETI